MPSSPVSATLSTADSGTERGWELYRAGEVSDALAMFDSVLTATPEDDSALLGRGRCHRLLGAFDDAIADFTRAHELRPSAARPLFERGAIFILQGRYAETRADYDAARALEPDYPGAMSYFAELFLYTGRAGDALGVSERALRDEPTNLMHRINIAHAHLLLGDLEQAARSYAAIAEGVDLSRRMTGAEIALADLGLMRAAGIEPLGMVATERFLRSFGHDVR